MPGGGAPRPPKPGMGGKGLPLSHVSDSGPALRCREGPLPLGGGGGPDLFDFQSPRSVKKIHISVLACRGIAAHMRYDKKQTKLPWKDRSFCLENRADKVAGSKPWGRSLHLSRNDNKKSLVYVLREPCSIPESCGSHSK